MTFIPSLPEELCWRDKPLNLWPAVSLNYSPYQILHKNAPRSGTHEIILYFFVFYIGVFLLTFKKKKLLLALFSETEFVYVYMYVYFVYCIYVYVYVCGLSPEWDRNNRNTELLH